MRRFLVEAYTPADTAIGVIEDRARQATAELSEPETPARHVRPIFVPEDETCFYLLDAASRDAAAAAIQRAGISPQRISEAVHTAAGSEDWQ
jgi:hypothetical protein